MSDVSHPLKYDGKLNELFKIYLLNILFNILTLGMYHFWGKTRKRRYIASAVQLDHDRFEYTGYAKELIVGIIIGLLSLLLLSTPLLWATYTIANHENTESLPSATSDKTPDNINTPHYHIEQYDHLKKNKIIIDYTKLTQFWIVANNYAFLIHYDKPLLELQLLSNKSYGSLELPLIFNPSNNRPLLVAILLIPFYIAFYLFYLPFTIVYGSLRYRASRLRWRGIRGHLRGSSLLYASLGFFHVIMKAVTLGFWIPISDLSLLHYKIKRLSFGNQSFQFTPRFTPLIQTNLATLGASLYLIILMFACGYFLLPLIATYSPTDNEIVKSFLIKIIEKGYLIFLALLLWGCYVPRYWYKAALLRERYNALTLNNIRFHCNASGKQYFILFVLNDFIFIFTLGFGLPIIWQRKMRFVAKHLTVKGDLRNLSIQQAPGEKTRLGAGLASIINVEVGLL